MIIRFRNVNVQLVIQSEKYFLSKREILYYQERPGFRLDLRWKEELGKDDLQNINAEMGSLQQRFGYS